MRRLGAAFLTLLVGACADLAPSPEPLPVWSAPQPAPASFRLEGRVAVRSGEQNFSGGISWRHGQEQDDILLTAPLGQGVAELRATPGEVVLVDGKGQRHQAVDAESLTRQVLGMTLPLRGLGWWVTGHSRPDAEARFRPDETGRLAGLSQDGWEIEFSRYRETQGVTLPGKLVARRGEDLEVRLVADTWELP